MVFEKEKDPFSLYPFGWTHYHYNIEGYKKVDKTIYDFIINKMNEINISSNKSFGIIFFIFFLLISLYPIINEENIRIWSLIVSLIFLILGIKNSIILSPLNKLWFRFGLLLGRIISPIIMGVIFFLVVTPTGLLMRLFNQDLLKLKFNKNQSYWIAKNDPKSKMKNQF